MSTWQLPILLIPVICSHGIIYYFHHNNISSHLIKEMTRKWGYHSQLVHAIRVGINITMTKNIKPKLISQ